MGNGGVPEQSVDARSEDSDRPWQGASEHRGWAVSGWRSFVWALSVIATTPAILATVLVGYGAVVALLLTLPPDRAMSGSMIVSISIMVICLDRGLDRLGIDREGGLRAFLSYRFPVGGFLLWLYVLSLVIIWPVSLFFAIIALPRIGMAPAAVLAGDAGAIDAIYASWDGTQKLRKAAVASPLVVITLGGVLLWLGSPVIRSAPLVFLVLVTTTTFLIVFLMYARFWAPVRDAYSRTDSSEASTETIVSNWD